MNLASCNLRGNIDFASFSLIFCNNVTSEILAVKLSSSLTMTAAPAAGDTEQLLVMNRVKY